MNVEEVLEYKSEQRMNCVELRLMDRRYFPLTPSACHLAAKQLERVFLTFSEP